MAIELTNWRTLTEAVNNIIAPPSFLTDTLFKTARQNLTDKLDVDIITGNQKLSPFVGKSDAAAVIEKSGFNTKTITLPRIRVKKGFSAYELLAERAAGENVYVAGGSMARFKDQRMNLELVDLKARITRRVEWMAANALQGGITYSGASLGFTMDFGMPVANKPTLTSTAKWDAPTTCDPAKNLREWNNIITQATGLSADIAILGTAAAEGLLASTKAMALLNKFSGIQAGQLQLDNSRFIGILNGIKLYVYSDVYTDDAGTTGLPLIPTNACILVSSQAKIVMEYGAIFDNAAGTVASKFFSKQYEDHDPSVIWMLAETSVAPVVYQPAGIVFATVL